MILWVYIDDAVADGVCDSIAALPDITSNLCNVTPHTGQPFKAADTAI